VQGRVCPCPVHQSGQPHTGRRAFPVRYGFSGAGNEMTGGNRRMRCFHRYVIFPTPVTTRVAR
jgi:hypothetical protein